MLGGTMYFAQTAEQNFELWVSPTLAAMLGVAYCVLISSSLWAVS